MSAKHLTPKTPQNLQPPTRSEKIVLKEICETPGNKKPPKPAYFPDPRDSANLEKTKHLNVATLDLYAVNQDIESSFVTPKKNRSSLSKFLRAFKPNSDSEGKTPFLGRGTWNRERFLSLDSSDIFQHRSGNFNRRSSWYGGSIRNTGTSFRKYPDTQQFVLAPKPNRKRNIWSSNTSVQTFGSDDLPVQCPTKFKVKIDVHRTASGEPVCTGVRNVPKLKPKKGGGPNLIIDVYSPSKIHNDNCTLRVPQGVSNASQLCIYGNEIYELNGKFCKWWLEGIDKVTLLCPGCSEYVGPALITVSLLAGLIIVLTAIIFFMWIIGKLGVWWK